MCCFSNAAVLDEVTGTQIFARHADRGRQLLAYSMTVAARDELAMILPVPVPPECAEDAVRFINLEAYADFFDDLDKGFPHPVSRQGPVATSLAQAGHVLEVHDVGAFEASFVPCQRDFGRLDPRFSIPSEVWASMPEYVDYGFAVFKLKSFARKDGWFRRLFFSAPADTKTVHPMAFEFPTRSAEQLFFPTVHIHDGEVHDTAAFDHTLYCQLNALDTPTPKGWRMSAGSASGFMRVAETRGLVLADHCCFRQKLDGELPNRDTRLSA